MTAQIFKIKGDMVGKYRGAGHAFAAIKDDQLVDLVYFEELFDENDYTDTTDSEVTKLIKDDRAAVEVFRLAELGQLAVGICITYEFIIQ
jgi:hypothetical protein